MPTKAIAEAGLPQKGAELDGEGLSPSVPVHGRSEGALVVDHLVEGLRRVDLLQGLSEVGEGASHVEDVGADVLLRGHAGVQRGSR